MKPTDHGVGYRLGLFGEQGVTSVRDGDEPGSLAQLGAQSRSVLATEMRSDSDTLRPYCPALGDGCGVGEPVEVRSGARSRSGVSH